MYTFYQKLILQELLFHAYCSLSDLDKMWYTKNSKPIYKELQQEVSTLFGFDFVAFTKAEGSGYSNPNLNKEEPPFIPEQKNYIAFLRKCVEIVRIRHDSKKMDHPYAPENYLYRLVTTSLPNQFNFRYDEHVQEFPLPHATSHLAEAGMIEVQIGEHVVWAFPYNIVKNNEGCISSIFEFQAQAMLYVFGVDFLNEQISFLKKTDYELWNERR